MDKMLNTTKFCGLIVALFSVLISAKELHDSYKVGSPFGESRTYLKQANAWSRNLECVQEKEWHVVSESSVGVIICESTDIVVKYPIPGGASYQWVFWDTNLNLLANEAIDEKQNNKKIIETTITSDTVKQIQSEDDAMYEVLINLYTGDEIKKVKIKEN